MSHVPELLAPAGSLEKLKVAVNYGSDAVYLGGEKFGLRSAAENFTFDEMREGVAYSHEKGTSCYVVLNSFLHDDELLELPEFLDQLVACGVDAVIVSDLGVLETVRAHGKLPIHLSTQASCLNVEAAKLWKEAGVKRIVLGREVSLEEAAQIKRQSGLEIEMFIHGSMCMAYSGNCVISNYTSGRDSNRGGCAHSCRFEYQLDFDGERKNSFFMSSKDLNGIRLLKEYADAGIDSLKVEGRMKSYLYAGTITRAYRRGLDLLKNKGGLSPEEIIDLNDELEKVTHREYTEASLEAPADASSVYGEREHEIKDWAAAGVVQAVIPGEGLVVEVRRAFVKGSKLEIMPFNGRAKSVELDVIRRLDGEELEKTNPGTVVKIPWVEGVECWNLVRQPLSGELS